MANRDIDPSGLLTIRITVAREISGRFDRFMADLQSLLVTDDALGITTRPGEMPIGNAASQRWRFLSSPDKLVAFQAWVKERVDAGLLQSDSPDPDKPWLSKYLQSAYLSGLGRSFLDAKAASLLPEQIKELSKAQFLSQALTSPVATDTLKLMYMRNFTQLKGVTDKMSATMSTILADELSKGSGPAKIASRLRKEMGFSKNRAIVIAQTELSYVQSEGQLDGYEAAGLSGSIKLRVLVEWLTAASPCAACAAMKGVVLTIKEARGKIPFHPRCVVGDTRISTPSVTSVSRSKYTGKIIEIITAEGRKLSVTEHHVLLSQRGWLLAKDITETDYLVDASSLYGNVLKRPYDDQEIPRIADYFTAVSEAGGVTSETSTNPGPEDFHGDGKFLTSEINTKRLDGFLGDDLKARSIRQSLKSLLMPRNLRKGLSSDLATESALTLQFVALAAASDSFMGFHGVESVLFRGSRPHHEPVSRSEIAGGETCGSQTGIDSTTRQAVQSGEGVDGDSGLKLLDNLLHDLGRDSSTGQGGGFGLRTDNPSLLQQLSEKFRAALELLSDSGYGVSCEVDSGNVVYDRVNVVTSRHVIDLPVYDAETQETIYVANGLVSSNCRCAWGPVNIYGPPTPGQKRSKKAIQRAIGDAVKAATGEKTVKGAKAKSKWQGASLRPTGKRTLKLPTADAATPPQLPPKDTRETPKGVGYTVNRSLTGRIVKSGSKGVPVSLGGSDIRDQSGVIFTTQGPQGPVTNINLTVTPEGSKKITQTLGATYETERIKFRPSEAAPEDPHFKPLSSTAAMVDARKVDGKYNEIAIANTRDTLQKLKTTLDSKTPAPPVEKDVARHYVKQVEAVLKSQADRTSPPAVSPYRPTRDPKAPTNRSPFPVVKEDLSLPVRTFSDGTGTDTAKHQKLPGESYKIQLPGGVSAHFVPTSGRPQNAGNPLQGSLTIQVPGKASEATIKSAINSVASLGVKTKPLTAAQEELEYLHKVVELRGDAKKQPYGVVRRNILLSDAQKVAKVKEFARTRYQIDLKKAPADYKPQGRPLSADGTGPRVWDRWDLSRETVKAEMSGYALQYTPSGQGDAKAGSIPNAVQSILASGGIVMSVADKARKGISLATGGANLVADSTSGAAGYVFTRIRKLDQTEEVTGLFFKPESLARLDAVSLDGVAFGSASSPQRLTTIAEWVLAASNASNETYFQQGLDLLSDLDFIRTPSTRDALATIQAFKAAGVESLPDGRKVADVVIVKTPSKPKKPRP